LRTMGIRLERHQESALALATWLEGHEDVAKVLHPALPSFEGHDIWKRDFKGASGLFSFVLREADPAKQKERAFAFLDALKFFGLGYSWGGFESLVLLADPAKVRTAVPWPGGGPLLRVHAGLEDPADLVADLEAGFDRLARAQGEAP